MTATTAGPPVVISAPPPQQPPFNLYTVAQEVPPAVDTEGAYTNRWLNGAEIYAYPEPAEATGIDPCLTGTFRDKDEGDGFEPFALFGSFSGYLAVTCSSFGINWDDLKARTEVAFQAGEPRLMEKQLMSGAFKMDNPFIADTNVTLLDGTTAHTAREALARLEDAVGATARDGVIHATPGTIVAWDALGLLVTAQGGVLKTTGGTPVVRGTGYIGAFPQGHSAPTANQSWAWATGPIVYERADLLRLTPEIKYAMDRSENTAHYRAERDMLVAWDLQLQAGILVDRSL